jgi:succinyl-CoA synthetase alpha subunit
VAIFVDQDTKVIVQGLTGGQGRFHGLRNRDYGTQVVAGVTPGKGGQDVEGIPIFDSVADAVAATADASSSPCRQAASTAIEHGGRRRVGRLITEGIQPRTRPGCSTPATTRPAALSARTVGIIRHDKCNIGI